MQLTNEDRLARKHQFETRFKNLLNLDTLSMPVDGQTYAPYYASGNTREAWLAWCEGWFSGWTQRGMYERVENPAGPPTNLGSWD